MKPWYLIVFAVGAVGLFAVTSRAQISRTVLPAPRAYLCFEGHSAAEVTDKANEAGARGWKMVSAAFNGSATVWCFEQYQAARPVPQPRD